MYASNIGRNFIETLVGPAALVKVVAEPHRIRLSEPLPGAQRAEIA